jgi:sugar phosphate isomerase/epimerase
MPEPGAVYPGARRRRHDPIAVRDLVRRLDSPAAGMLLARGHLCTQRPTWRARTAPGRSRHARPTWCSSTRTATSARGAVGCPGSRPIRLDLHLAPARGSLPWARVAATVASHPAPVMLEVERSHRPALRTLAADTLRSARRARVAAA